MMEVPRKPVWSLSPCRAIFSRSWFAWANTLFGELILGEVRHRIVQSVANTKENGNAYAHIDDTNRMAVVAAYPGITPFTGWRAYNALTNAERRIVSVDARRTVRKPQ